MSPSSRDTRVPVSLRDELRETIGEQAAARLFERFGGRQIYVPVRSSDDHPIAREIGLRAAQALSARFGGEIIDVPNRKRRELILELHETGMSAQQIAHRLQITRQWVHKVIARTRQGTEY